MNDLVKHLEALLAADSGNREREPVYVKDGDCLVFYSSDEPCHAHRFDGLVTVYLADKDPSQIVGCQIKGVHRMLKKFGEFGVEIGQRPHALGFFFIIAGVHPDASPVARGFFDSELASRQVDLSEACHA